MMLGLVTIGQSPRDDIVVAMFGEEEPGGLVQTGALDQLSHSEILALAPASNEPVLVSRLRDGNEVDLAKPRLMIHVQQAVDGAIDQGATVVCVLCTGDFSQIDARGVRLVTPDKLVRAIVDVMLPAGRLGVLMPHCGQAVMMREKWTSGGRSIIAITLSPYAPDAAPSRAVQELVDANVDLVVMDCMGYTREHWKVVRSELSVPVVLSNGLTGSILREVALAGSIHHSLQVQ